MLAAAIQWRAARLTPARSTDVAHVAHHRSTQHTAVHSLLARGRAGAVGAADKGDASPAKGVDGLC
jgi:hypothetical protein